MTFTTLNENRKVVAFDEQPHRMYLDDAKQSAYEKSLKVHAEKVAEKHK